MSLFDNICFCFGSTVLLGLGLLVVEVPRSHWDTPHTEGVLWTSVRPVAETSTWPHTTLTRKRRPCLRRVSNPQSQHASGRRPTRPPGSASIDIRYGNVTWQQDTMYNTDVCSLEELGLKTLKMSPLRYLETSGTKYPWRSDISQKLIPIVKKFIKFLVFFLPISKSSLNTWLYVHSIHLPASL